MSELEGNQCSDRFSSGGSWRTKISFLPLRLSVSFSLKLFYSFEPEMSMVCLCVIRCITVSCHTFARSRILACSGFVACSGSWPSHAFTIISSYCIMCWNYSRNESGSSNGIFYLLLRCQLHKQVIFLGTSNTLQPPIFCG